MDTTQTFTRKARIGINPLTLEQGETKFLHILSSTVEVMTTKDGRQVDYVMATDMQTGEEGHFWLAAALKNQLEKLTETKGTIMDLKLEVKHLGKKKVEIDGEKREVNNFELYELN